MSRLGSISPIIKAHVSWGWKYQTYLNLQLTTYNSQRTHTHIQTYRHTDIQTYIQTHIHTYIHTYIYIYIHTYIHTYIYTYIHTYIYTYICTYIHTYIHTYIYTYIHIYIHTYIHTYLRYSSIESGDIWCHAAWQCHVHLQGDGPVFITSCLLLRVVAGMAFSFQSTAGR